MKFTKREQRAIAENYKPKHISKEDVKFIFRKDDCGNCGLKWLTLRLALPRKICRLWNEYYEKFLSCGL